MTGTTPGREREALLEWLSDQRAHVLDGRTWLGPQESRVPRD